MSDLAITELRSRHLLSTQPLSEDELALILSTAASFDEVGRRELKKVPPLRGKTVINFFFENSTRTRTSFELAGKRLSADVINLSASASSVAKGETLIDTAKSLDAMGPDIVVIRHSESGAPELMSHYTRASVINAGDGSHEHPTQALLDLFTISKHLGFSGVSGFKGFRIAIVGDILHSRVARSNIHALKTLGAHITVVAPKTLLPMQIERLGVSVSTDLRDGIRGQDAIMMLRIQKERMGLAPFPSLREYAMVYGLNKRVLKDVNSKALILHPGPINRGVEIAGDVADSEASLILNQVESGVAVRMALLYLLSGKASDLNAQRSHTPEIREI